MGNAYRKLQKMDDAVNAYRRTVALERQHDQAWYYLGLVYENQKLFKQSESAYKTALNINPKHQKADRALKRLDKYLR